MTSKCKSCGKDVNVNAAEMYSIEESDISEELYQQRLSTCMECPSLLYGTTCQHSGCIVHYRAMIQEKSCPHPKEAKW
ncbi:DUF6171 family protein [Salipaludibacillus sp. HK11]|uniref:DUF6171 family protein n=1 Tax=Salipaludibacillus sp. HK11 TaxID=3394320 RepID=UPI0039FCBD02